MGLLSRVAALLGVSTYTLPPSPLPSLGSPLIERARKAFGGQITRLPATRMRWILADLEAAMIMADAGDLSKAAQLARAIRRDGVLAGVLSTRTTGVIGLPKRFSGDDEMVRVLEGRDGSRSVFDEMCPAAELALMCADELFLGVSVGELLPVEGRDYPVLRRLDPEGLRYRWAENRWYYQSTVGLLPITPGDGRWVLHVGGGVTAPWQNGLWYALGQAWIDKQHARLHKANWEAVLANPARVAVSPQGASEAQKQSWFQRVMAWGVNTVFGMTPGYDVKLLESNGRGFESFNDTIARAEREFVIAISGSTVLVDGGTGFANADVHKSIRDDLIAATAGALAYTINTQIIPAFVFDRWGEGALPSAPVVAWDTTPPVDQKAVADATSALGKAIVDANTALAPYGKRVDAVELALRFGIPIEDAPAPAPANDSAGAPPATANDTIRVARAA